jgi:AcrR family transcriptional regulator
MVAAIWIAYTIWIVPEVLTRKEAQERTRQRVLAAAAKVFARRGYHRATVDEIASEAGFTIGALYSNFAGKEELFLALADRQVEERVAEVGAIADAAEGAEPGQDSSATPNGRFSSTSSGR